MFLFVAGKLSGLGPQQHGYAWLRPSWQGKAMRVIMLSDAQAETINQLKYQPVPMSQRASSRIPV